MFGETTWSERSTFLAMSLEGQISSIIQEHGLNYGVKHTMSGFNDRLIIKDQNTESGDYFMVSIIIGWLYADAEIAVVHRFNNDTEFEYVTDNYIEFDNYKYQDLVDEDRFAGYLNKNVIKYYPSPFDEREDEILEDVKKFLLRK